MRPTKKRCASAHVSGMAAYQALCDEAEADFEGYLGRSGA